MCLEPPEQLTKLTGGASQVRTQLGDKRGCPFGRYQLSNGWRVKTTKDPMLSQRRMNRKERRGRGVFRAPAGACEGGALRVLLREFVVLCIVPYLSPALWPPLTGSAKSPADRARTGHDELGLAVCHRAGLPIRTANRGLSSAKTNLALARTARCHRPVAEL